MQSGFREQGLHRIRGGWTAEVIIHILQGALKDVPRDEEIVVLSMYDGIGTGRYCLEQMGFTNIKYYAYEIDPYAIKISESNYPDIIQLGNAFDLRNEDWHLPEQEETMDKCDACKHNTNDYVCKPECGGCDGESHFEEKSQKYIGMNEERAAEILDPTHREQYEDIEEVNEACRMGRNALLHKTRTPNTLVFAKERLADESKQSELGANNDNDIRYWAAYIDGAKAQAEEDGYAKEALE